MITPDEKQQQNNPYTVLADKSNNKSIIYSQPIVHKLLFGDTRGSESNNETNFINLDTKYQPKSNNYCLHQLNMAPVIQLCHLTKVDAAPIQNPRIIPLLAAQPSHKLDYYPHLLNNGSTHWKRIDDPNAACPECLRHVKMPDGNRALELKNCKLCLAIAKWFYEEKIKGITSKVLLFV